MSRPSGPIPIVFGVDNRFALPLAAAIQSALDNLGPGHRLAVHVIDGGLSEGNRAKLLRSFAGRACRFEWLKPETGTLASLKVGGAITVATYYRLLIPRLLPNLDKAIYLDADLIVLRDLAELWDIAIEDNHLLAVQDQGIRLISGPFGLTNYLSLGIPDAAKYFNAGVLVMNLARWRREDTAEAILTYIKEHHEHIRFHDQDGLNAVLWNRWGEIDPRWNQMPQILQVPRAEESPFDCETFLRVIRDPFIVHYASADKPWRYGCRHPATARFLHYQDKTAFGGWRPSAGRQWVSDRMNWMLTRIRRVSRLMV